MGGCQQHILSAAVLVALFLGGVSMAGPILIEAEGFERRGGWRLDQQFTHEMGSPYLLAHGLGRPVEDAVTTVGVQQAGIYHVWVRTRDWVPGPWQAPGRFTVKIGDTWLSTEFGTREGWGWQDGGTLRLGAGQVRIALHDLTGFDGRCDAIALCDDLKFVPPEGEELARWRRTMRGEPAEPPAAGTFDVVIVGGGISGCAAALAADSQGLKVALIHDRPVLGGNASGEIRVHTEGICGTGIEILEGLDTVHWPNGSADALEDDTKRTATMTAAENTRLFLNWRAYGVTTDGARITAVDARNTSTNETMRAAAALFIDCTGDGWIGYWAGADHRYGREGREEFGETWDRWGELWSPETPDNRVMGSSLLWYSRKTDGPSDFPDVPWAMPVAGTHAAVKGEWYWEFSSNDLHQINDAEAIRDHNLRAIYGSFANAKRQAKYATHVLDWVGYLSGKRESRRLMGDYVYSLKDAVSQTFFPDTVVTETRAVDVHYQRHLAPKPKTDRDFLSEAIFRRVGRYYIPFRCLYSRNIQNLMMAGRCFSCTHIGLGGPRVMLTCGQMGIATGYAAALCRKHDATPRQVGKAHIAELKALVGIEAPPPKPPPALSRTSHGKFRLDRLPETLEDLPRITVMRGDMHAPAPAYTVRLTVPATVYIGVHDRGTPKLPDGWTKTGMSIVWGKTYRDLVYSRACEAGHVTIPGHDGKEGAYYGLPHIVFIKAAGAIGDAPVVTGLPDGRDAVVFD